MFIHRNMNVINVVNYLHKYLNVNVIGVVAKNQLNKNILVGILNIPKHYLMKLQS